MPGREAREDPPVKQAIDPNGSVVSFLEALTKMAQPEPSAQLPKFDGTCPLDEFMAQFTLICQARKWGSIKKAEKLAAALSGKARSVLLTMSPELNEDSYDELVYALQERYHVGDKARRSLIGLYNKRQGPTEDAVTFGRSICQMMAEAYPQAQVKEREALMIQNYQNGLKCKEARRQVLKAMPTSLAQAMDIAILEETLESWMDPSADDQKDKKAAKPQNRVGAVGEKSDSGEAAMEEVRKLRAELAQKETSNNTGNSADRPRPPKCWACGGAHVLRNCPDTNPAERRKILERRKAVFTEVARKLRQEEEEKKESQLN